MKHYVQFKQLCDVIFYCRFFKEELSRVSENGNVRSNILQSIRDVEKEILSTLKLKTEQMKMENLNMEKAIQLIEKNKREEQ